MSEASQIPEKTAYKGSEVCQYTDTQPYVLRFWESEFPQLNPGKGPSGRPVYSRQHIDLILRIKQLLYEEQQTIAGARQRLDQEQGDRPRRRSPRSGSPSGPRATPPGVEEQRAEVRDGETRTATRSYDAVPRERYEDALDEIAHLRLQLKDAEARCRKAETVLDKSKSRHLRDRQRAETAVERLERLLEILTSDASAT